MMYYLNLDENNYLLSISTVGQGVEANINLDDYDLTGDRIRAHKWENDKLTFDAVRYAEIEAEILKEAETQECESTEKTNNSVYDELAAAYRQGVQEA